MPIALLALTISAFAIGTTEFVIVGLIPTMAADLGVSLPSAGPAGQPVRAGRRRRRPGAHRAHRQAAAQAAAARPDGCCSPLGNLLAWKAPGYDALIVARILTGLAHGVFFSIGSTIATGLVPKEKAASAIAIMFTGLTVALVTGVPLGTFIGQHFGWRADLPRRRGARRGSPSSAAWLVRAERPPPSRAGHRWCSSSACWPSAAPAAGLRDDGGRLRRFVHRLHLPGTDPPAGQRHLRQRRRSGAAGVRHLGGGRQHLGRQAGRQARPHRRAQDHLRAARRRAVRAEPHRAAPVARRC